MRDQGSLCLFLCSCLIVPCLAEPPTGSFDINKKIDVTDGKLKRQNDVEPVAGGGEEIDLSGVPGVGQNPNQPSNPRQPGAPQQPGQSPFFGNPYFPQQPFYNGFNGYNGLNGINGYNGLNGFGFPGAAPGFPQAYPQPGGPSRSVIIQNNGKQFLVQPLSTNQRIVQKNGKQYLLQPLTTDSAALSGYNGGQYANFPVFNVPNSALTGLNAGNGAALTSINPGALGLTNAAYTNYSPALVGSAAQSALPAYSPSASAVEPSSVPPNSKLAPQRVIINNGGRYVVEQIPIRTSDSQPFLSSAVGAVAAQLAIQPGSQYAQNFRRQYSDGSANGVGLSDAYERANQAGYGLYATGRSFDGLVPAEAEIKKRKV